MRNGAARTLLAVAAVFALTATGCVSKSKYEKCENRVVDLDAELKRCNERGTGGAPPNGPDVILGPGGPGQVTIGGQTLQHFQATDNTLNGVFFHDIGVFSTRVDVGGGNLLDVQANRMTAKFDNDQDGTVDHTLVIERTDWDTFHATLDGVDLTAKKRATKNTLRNELSGDLLELETDYEMSNGTTGTAPSQQVKIVTKYSELF